MTHDPHSADERTPIDVGLDLLIAHQHIVTELVALGLATFAVVLIGSLGVGLAQFVAWLAAPLRHSRNQRHLLTRRRRAPRVAVGLSYHSNKGDIDGI
ncbi:MAG: hypothetical protein AAFO28_07800 [Pseudomonadota bacterium]